MPFVPYADARSVVKPKPPVFAMVNPEIKDAKSNVDELSTRPTEPSANKLSEGTQGRPRTHKVGAGPEKSTVSEFASRFAVYPLTPSSNRMDAVSLVPLTTVCVEEE